jgi:DNA-binding NarL/FixJ family response regulator
MGLDLWVGRADSELAATGSTARRGPQRDAALTSQETRVALFVARGMTNREIAAALFLSPRTVEHHVTGVLRKRGLRSRVELAAAFAP